MEQAARSALVIMEKQVGGTDVQNALLGALNDIATQVQRVAARTGF